MLSAASESVLMAVESCWFEREPATPWVVAERATPMLSEDEARTILALLVADGYLHVERATFDYPPNYVLTDRGQREAARVVALALNEKEARS